MDDAVHSEPFDDDTGDSNVDTSFDISTTAGVLNNFTINKSGWASVTNAVGPLTVGGLLWVQAGVFNSASSYHDVQIDAGGTLSMGDDTTVSGDFTNGGTFTHNNHEVTPNEAGVHNLAASAATAFFDLTVSNGVILVEAIADDNVTVAGTLTNLGTIRKTKPIALDADVTYGLTAVVIHATNLGSPELGDIQVDRVDSSHPNATTETATGRYWTLTPAGAPAGYAADLTLLHNNLADPAACRYTTGWWECARASFTDSTVKRAGVGAFSDWAVGTGFPAAAIPAVTISRSGGNALLSWTHVAADSGGYKVWWSTDPYFTPGTGVDNVWLVAPTASYPHASVPGVNHYFVVVGINGVGQPSGNSNRVGDFMFSLVAAHHKCQGSIDASASATETVGMARNMTHISAGCGKN